MTYDDALQMVATLSAELVASRMELDDICASADQQAERIDSLNAENGNLRRQLDRPGPPIAVANVNMVARIKAMRELTGLGLKNAKQVVDALYALEIGQTPSLPIPHKPLADILSECVPS